MDGTYSLNLEKIRKAFPILTRKVNGKPLVYLDNSATTQKPLRVIKAIGDYYKESNANVHRGIHRLSEESTIQYELAHKKVADFIGAEFEEIIFTRGTTESLNLLAYSLMQDLKEGDEIILTEMEHHSNLVPWQQLAKGKGIVIKFIEVTEEGKLNIDDFKNKITDKTKIVSVTHISNVLGTINPIKEIGQISHEYGALFVVDGAQSVPHMPIDVKEIGCDFLAFSAHKMAGPTGIGVLYGKKHVLEKIKPFMYGGDMIKDVSFDDSVWNDLPWKFEAGTPNIAGAVGLSACIDYLTELGMDSIQSYEEFLTEYALKKLSEIDGIKIYGPMDAKERIDVLSFTVKGMHPHDVSTLLDKEGVAIRGGHHCAMPLMKKFGVPGLNRASFYFYNTTKEIDKLIEAIMKAKKVFKV